MPRPVPTLDHAVAEQEKGVAGRQTGRVGVDQQRSPHSERIGDRFQNFQLCAFAKGDTTRVSVALFVQAEYHGAVGI